MANIAKLTPDETARKNALESLPLPHREIAVKIRADMRRAAGGFVSIYHGIGTVLCALADDAADEAERDRNTEQLTVYLGMDGDARNGEVKRLREFAKAFTKEQVADWCNRAGEYEGRPLLTVSHFFLLSHLSDEKERIKMLEKTLKDHLSADMFGADLMTGIAPRGGRRKKGGGRKSKMPASPVGGMQKWYEALQRAHNMSPLVEQFVFSRIDTMSNDQTSMALLKKLEESKEMLETFVTEATDVVLPRIDMSIERVKTLEDGKGGAAVNGKAAGEKTGAKSSAKPGAKASAGGTARRRPAVAVAGGRASRR